MNAPYNEWKEKTKDHFQDLLEKQNAVFKNMAERQKQRERAQKQKIIDKIEKTKTNVNDIMRTLDQITSSEDKHFQRNRKDMKPSIPETKKDIPSFMTNIIKIGQYGKYPLIPKELWNIVKSYADPYTLLRLEFVSRALYMLFSKPCHYCSKDILSKDCDNVWRGHYSDMDCPLVIKYNNAPCRALRFICVREIAKKEFEVRYGRIKTALCEKEIHAVEDLENKSSNSEIKIKACTLCGIGFSSKNYCLKVCSKHTKFSCMKKITRFSSAHSCHCVICYINSSSTFLQLKKDIAFVRGIKYEGVISERGSKDNKPTISFYLDIS